MRKLVYASFLALIAVALNSDSVPAQSVTPACPKTASATTFENATLDTAAADKNGVVYKEVAAVGSLRLGNKGGTFKPDAPIGADLNPPDAVVSAASADFNGDGWIDYVGGQSDGTTMVYRNHTIDNIGAGPSEFNDPNYVRAPKFLASTPMVTDGNTKMLLAAGDFDGDSDQDIVRINVSTGDNEPKTISAFINTGNDVSNDPIFTNHNDALLITPGILTPFAGMAMPGRNSNIVVTDYNGDGFPDLLIASTQGTGGSIHKFRNCLGDPVPIPGCDKLKFYYDDPNDDLLTAPNGEIISDLGIGLQTPSFAYDDFDGDGLKDLVVGAPNCCGDPTKNLRLFKGIAPVGTIDSASAQELRADGDAVFILSGDFSLDGKPDIIVGTDADLGVVTGGQAFYYENNGSGTPLSDVLAPLTYPTAQVAFNGNPLGDFDIGLAFNYDNDPQNSIDLIIADDGAPADYKILANRADALYVDSGTVVSGILDLGPLSNTEMVVDVGRINPTATIPAGGDIKWYMSNTEPPDFQLIDPVADVCVDEPGWLCVDFPKKISRVVRWKAELTPDPGKTQTPVIDRVEVKFDYTESAEHYRAGVIVVDGVAYVSAFSQPGQRGKFYALSADLSTPYWEAGDVLDNTPDSSRNVYTVAADGFTRLNFQFSNPLVFDPNDMALFGINLNPGTTDWARSARFGVGNTGIDTTRLGAIENSTPAVVVKPGLTPWYVFADATERANIEAFIAANDSRVPIAMFGAKDGMIHAIRNDATQIANASNGSEAWAFVPYPIAATMKMDFLANAGTDPTDMVITTYPDGSPTVATAKVGGTLATVTVVGSGGGGSSFSALDITDTLDPKPLWHNTPLEAGRAVSKATVIRVQIAGSERFIAVTATGTHTAEPTAPYTKGIYVEAYDLSTGALLWKAKTACPVTSDITAFETDDDNGVLPAPAIDGYIDRIVFADKCGYVYKVDPGQDLGGAFLSNTNFGAVPPLPVPPVPDTTNLLEPLFSTVETPDAVDGALDPQDVPPPSVGLYSEEERPIAGAIAARTDATGDIVLFFGTGGLEEFERDYHNEFFAVYAKNGVVRSKQVGTCEAVPAPKTCEKFYGGIVATSEQVVFAATEDPRPATGTCDKGDTTINIVKVNQDTALATVENFVDDFGGPPITLGSAAVSSSLFARGGAIFLTTQSGQIVSVGTTNASVAGSESASGSRNRMGQGQGGSIGTDDPITLMAWRQIF